MGNTQIKDIHDEQMKIIQNDLFKDKISEIEDKEEYNRIIRMNAGQLRELILNKKMTVKKMFNYFHHRKREEANAHFNFTKILFDKPLERSKQLDKLVSYNNIKNQDMPLLGFNISIKDTNKLKGSPSTFGFAINIDKIQPTQPETIKLLIEKGAVITCKGNVPMSAFSSECDNNIWGTGLNPYDKKRTPGGSSGGDCALVALNCVNAGIGSDIAGSLRIPALFCGVVGFKPTTGRVSTEVCGSYFELHEFSKSLPNPTEIIKKNIGPITRSVSDCETLLTVLVETSKFDTLIAPLGWRKFEVPKKVGLFMGFSQLEISAANRRGLEIAGEALKKNGIELIGLDLDEFFEDMFVTFGSSYSSNLCLKAIFTGQVPLQEPLTPAFDNLKRLSKLPLFMIRLLIRMEGDSRRSLFLKAIYNSYTRNDAQIAKDIQNVQTRFRAFLKEKDIEYLIAPGLATPAVTLGSSSKNLFQGVYTYMFNGLEYPAGALPITKVKENEQYYETKFNDEIAQSLKDVMKESKGLPVGIQVCGMFWLDEGVIELMKIIEKEVNFEYM